MNASMYLNLGKSCVYESSSLPSAAASSNILSTSPITCSCSSSSRAKVTQANMMVLAVVS